MAHGIDVYKAGGVLIRGRKFLIVRAKGKNIFYAPGGKIEQGETPKKSLVRELKEEVSIDVLEQDIEYFETFVRPVAGREHFIIKMDVFFVHAWQGEIAAASEIEEVRWIDSKLSTSIKIGSIFGEEVLPRLKERNLID